MLDLEDEWLLLRCWWWWCCCCCCPGTSGLCRVPWPLSEEGDRLWEPPELAAGWFPTTRGEDEDVRRWWCDGRVLYAVDGRDIDCFAPFFRLPTMWEARLEPETGRTDGTILYTPERSGHERTISCVPSSRTK